MNLPNWKRSLIKYYNEDKVNSSLAAIIQLQQNLIIASDESKFNKVSGGARIIVDMAGKTLVLGTKPDFGIIQHIHSYRAEIYGVLSVFTFLQEYSKYYILTFKSKVEYYCDNIEVVHKINTLFNNPNSFNEQHKTADHNAVLQLKECILKQFIAFHVKGHQDKRKKWELLTIPERLNIQANELIGKNAKVPINNHIINTSMEIYINGKYTSKKYVAGIYSYCGEKKATYFLINTYRWSKSTIADIKWDLQANFIKKQTYSRKKTLIKFVNRWLASGNKNYGQKLTCPHCRQQESTSMDHDHFLTFSSSGRRKQLRLNLLNILVQHLKTPPALSKLLIHSLQSFYNSQINNNHASEFKAITTNER